MSDTEKSPPTWAAYNEAKILAAKCKDDLQSIWRMLVEMRRNGIG